MLLADARVLGELTEIEAGDGLGLVSGILAEAVKDNMRNNIKVILVPLKDGRVLLPELLSMAGTPLEVLTLDLLEQLLDGAERLLVLLEVLSEGIEHLSELRVNPVAVLQLGDESNNVDVRHLVLICGNGLHVINQHEEDAHILLLVVEVE